MKKFFWMFICILLLNSSYIYANNNNSQLFYPNFKTRSDGHTIKLVFIKEQSPLFPAVKASIYSIDKQNNKTFVQEIWDDEIISVFQADGYLADEKKSIYLITRRKVNDSSKNGYFYSTMELPILLSEGSAKIDFWRVHHLKYPLKNCFDGIAINESNKKFFCDYKTQKQVKQFIASINAEKREMEEFLPKQINNINLNDATQLFYPTFETKIDRNTIKLAFIKNDVPLLSGGKANIYSIDKLNHKKFIKEILDDEIVSVFQTNCISGFGECIYLITRGKIEYGTRNGYNYNTTELRVFTERVDFYPGVPIESELINCFDGIDINEPNKKVTCNYKTQQEVKLFIDSFNAKKQEKNENILKQINNSNLSDTQQLFYPTFETISDGYPIKLIFIKNKEPSYFTGKANLYSTYYKLFGNGSDLRFIETIQDDEIVSVFKADDIKYNNMSIYLITRKKVKDRFQNGYIYRTMELPISIEKDGAHVYSIVDYNLIGSQFTNCFEGIYINKPNKKVSCNYKSQEEVKQFIATLRAKYDQNKTTK